MKFSQIKSDDIITMNSFEHMADEVVSLMPRSPEGVTYSDISLRVYQESRVIFCKTDFLQSLFTRLAKCDINHTLITHHSDYPITENLWRNKPKCITRWFAQNAVTTQSDLIGVPIGLEPYKSGSIKSQYLISNFEELRTTPKINKVYCAWGNTNPSRLEVIDKLKSSGVDFTHEKVEFQDYIHHMSEHQFVASPAGNGLDCHRTWEALYVGAIPIVLRHPMYDHFKGLPILQIDDWSDLTPQLLEDFSNQTFDYQKLTNAYWHNFIRR